MLHLYSAVLHLYEKCNTVVNMKCERMRASTIPCRFWHISVVTVSGDHRSDYLLTYLLTHADGNGYGAFAGRGSSESCCEQQLSRRKNKPPPEPRVPAMNADAATQSGV